jgi:thiol-disulfide isomerase/thioredoxin
MMRLQRFLVVLILLATTSVKAQDIASWKVKDVKNYIDKSDSILVINFWATFCVPCVEEIPYLQSISNKYKDQKVKLLLVSLDLPSFYPNKIKTFDNEHEVNSEVVWFNETNANYFCPAIDKSWSGVIPATIFINKKTGYKKFIEEQMTPEQFEAELKKAL